ncbi:hypothetical protein [Streptococcus marmotae]|uniref:hypothetical protein n=1 Tax=Streptococcus marmotae TaxID=1825069 RepID=UPI000831535C|nr:hypothetical protein [Streptococcus marmotae]
MDTNQVGNLFEQIKAFVQKNKVAAISIVVAVIAVGGGYNFYQSQPKSVATAVNVEFSGYDGYGQLEYDSQEINVEIQRVAYRSVGFNKNQVEDLINRDPLILAEISASSSLNSKYKKANAIISSVSYNFDKTSELSNGDTVTLSISPKSSKSPIKKETKKFKVEGLEKTETISTKALLEEYPVTFIGFNNYGKIKLPTDKDGNQLFTISDTKENYKNGETVRLDVAQSYISGLEKEGKKLESSEIEVEVKDLKEISDISNITEALTKNDSYAKSKYENSDYATYTLEKQSDHISYNVASYSDAASGQIYLVSIYKISKQGKYDNSVQYAYYGYRYYVNTDNSLDLETSNKVYGYETQDLEKLRAELETEGYKEYKASSDK